MASCAIPAAAQCSQSLSAAPFILGHIGRLLWVGDYTPQGLCALLTSTLMTLAVQTMDIQQ
jgi:hypothetical protein